MLELRGVSVSYGRHRALEDASLRVGRGEIVVILGANGAGKTTLLKALCGISEGRATGSIMMDGEELLGRKPHEIVQAGISLVPEGRGIFPDLTVQENLVLGAYSERARSDEAANLVRVQALFPKLVERRRQVVRTMSGGEQQMVAIGRAMMSNPAVLALDEPSLGLSPLLTKELFQSLLEVKRAGLGILLVEQNARQSLKIADRGYLLENGTIVHNDDAKALEQDPTVQKAYLGGGGQTNAVGPPKTAEGTSPSEIAALAPGGLKSSRPASVPPAELPPAPRAPTMDIEDLVSRANLLASKRPAERPNGGAPYNPPAPAPAHDVPADRLRAVLDEIEAAARRAESYKPRYPRR